MKKTEIDYWITAMLESHPNVSDYGCQDSPGLIFSRIGAG